MPVSLGPLKFHVPPVIGCPFESLSTFTDDNVSLYGTNPIWGTIKTMNDFCASQFRLTPDGTKIIFAMRAALLPDFSGFTKHGMAVADLTTPGDPSTITNLVEYDLETPGLFTDTGGSLWTPGDFLHLSADGHYLVLKVFDGPTIAEAIASVHFATPNDPSTATLISITPGADWNLRAAMFLDPTGSFGWYITTQSDQVKSFRLTTPYDFSTQITDNTVALPAGAIDPIYVDIACNNAGFVSINNSVIDYIQVDYTVNGDGTIGLSPLTLVSFTTHPIVPSIFTRTLRVATVVNSKLLLFGWNFSPDPVYEMARITV